MIRSFALDLATRIMDGVIALVDWASAWPVRFSRSKTGQANPRVRHIRGALGYILHSYRLTTPNLRSWLSGRKELFPMVLQVQTINRCNARCNICPYPYTIHLQPREVMDDELFSKIVAECVTEPDLHDFVPMSKNEPLLDTRLEKRVAEFKARALPHQMVELVTNGSGLTPARAEALIASGVDLITVSVNAASEQTYNEVMVGLSWQQVMRNLDGLTRANLSQTAVFLRFVNDQENRHELAAFRKRWPQFNLFFFGVNNRSGTMRNYEELVVRPNQIRVFFQRLLGSRAYPICPYVVSLAHVLQDGSVPMCSNDWANREMLGNLRHNTLREIYNSPRMQEIRELMRQGRYEEIEACRHCSFWQEWLRPLR